MIQFIIAVTSIAALFLSQDKRESMRRIAPIFGLIAQPFWLYAAFSAGQWGIMILCIFYAAAWARGFYTYWVRQ